VEKKDASPGISVSFPLEGVNLEAPERSEALLGFLQGTNYYAQFGGDKKG
jgi:hypothetical protein